MIELAIFTGLLTKSLKQQLGMMMKFLFKLLLVYFSFSMASHATSTKLPGQIALHIAKTHYLHPVRLLHPYLDYWHMKGPLAEKAAQTVLETRFANVNECTKNSAADVVLLLEPHIFYNPQLRVFHAEYIARAYTSTGEPITRIKKQAQQIGELNIASDFFIEKSYTKAIDNVVAELVTDQAFLSSLDKNSQLKAGVICNNLDMQPLERLYY